jgi:hypothetical protein
MIAQPSEKSKLPEIAVLSMGVVLVACAAVQSLETGLVDPSL